MEKDSVIKSLSSDRQNLFESILQQTEELFADREAAQEWLSTPKVSLKGKTPLESLANDEGAAQIKEILTKAAYGIFS